MNDECALAGVSKPEFEMSGGGFKATFARNDYIGNVAAEVNDRGERKVDKLTETEKKILDIIPANPTTSISKIAEPLSLSRKNTLKHMAALKGKGIIERVGANYSGSWKVK